MAQLAQFVKAGTGSTDSAGAWTHTCVTPEAAGRIIFVHIFQDGGTTNQLSISGNSNINNLAGSAGWTQIAYDQPVGASNQGRNHLYVGRSTGTSAPVISGGNAGSEDLYIRSYEFKGVNAGTTLADIIEHNTAGNFANNASGVGGSILGTAPVSLGNDRVSIGFAAIDDDLVFSGAPLVASYAESGGTDGAIALGIDQDSVSEAPSGAGLANVYSSYSQVYGGSGGNEELALSIDTFGSPTMRHARAWIRKVGSPSDNLICDIHTADGSEHPTGSPVATATIAGSTLSTTGGWFAFDVEADFTASGAMYSMVLRRSGSRDTSNYYEMGYGAFSGSNFSSHVKTSGTWGILGGSNCFGGAFLDTSTGTLPQINLGAPGGSWGVISFALVPEGPRQISFDAQPGSFAVTGTAATLNRNKFFDAQPGSYAVTGVANTLSKGYYVNALPGSYSFTGFAATLAATRLFNAQPGSYSVTGFDADIRRTRFGVVTPLSLTVTRAARATPAPTFRGPGTVGSNSNYTDPTDEDDVEYQDSINPNGMILCVQMFQDGTGALPTVYTAFDEVRDLGGTLNQFTLVASHDVGSPVVGKQHIYLARITGALGTGPYSVFPIVSDNSGTDRLFYSCFAFQDVHKGTTIQAVIENGSSQSINGAGTGTTISDTGVTTNAQERLAVNFIAMNEAVTDLVSFTGESGGDWTLADTTGGGGTYFQEFAHGAALAMQTATTPASTTVNGGSDATTSSSWGVIGLAFRPQTPSTYKAPAAIPLTFDVQPLGRAAKGGATQFDMFVNRVVTGRGIFLGQAARTLTLSRSATGVRGTFGVVNDPLSLIFTPFGRRTALGAAARPLTLTQSALGRRVYTSQVNRVFTLSRTATGYKTAFAQSALPLTLGQTVIGRYGGVTSSALALTTTRTATGIRGAVGQTALPLTLNRTATGAAVVYGVVNRPLTFTVIGSPKGDVVGFVSLALDFTIPPIQRQRTALGVVNRPLTLARTAEGFRTALSAVNRPFTMTRTATGVRIALGVAARPMTLTRTTSGQVIKLASSALNMTLARNVIGLHQAIGVVALNITNARSAFGAKFTTSAASLSLTASSTVIMPPQFYFGRATLSTNVIFNILGRQQVEAWEDEYFDFLYGGMTLTREAHVGLSQPGIPLAEGNNPPFR